MGNLEESKIGTLDLFIPSAALGDMYKPDYLNFNLLVEDDGDSYLHFCWAECYASSENDNFYSEALMLGFGKRIYCFTEEATWIKNKEVDGWESIPCNSLAFNTLILENFFVIHEESELEAIDKAGKLYRLHDPMEIGKFREFAILLIGCTNTEIANMVIGVKDLKEMLEDKIGFDFEYLDV